MVSPSRIQVFHLSLLLLLGVGCSSPLPSQLAGIGGKSQPNLLTPVLKPDVKVMTIRDLQQSQSSGKTVYLQGKVGKQVPFLGSRAYELQDETGSIWVVTIAPAPQPGEEVLIKAQVRYQDISLSGQKTREWYVEEQEKLAQSTTQSLR